MILENFSTIFCNSGEWCRLYIIPFVRCTALGAPVTAVAKGDRCHAAKALQDTEVQNLDGFGGFAQQYCQHARSNVRHGAQDRGVASRYGIDRGRFLQGVKASSKHCISLLVSASCLLIKVNCSTAMPICAIAAATVPGAICIADCRSFQHRSAEDWQRLVRETGFTMILIVSMLEP